MDVFLSYCHEDRAWKNHVARFLQCMKQEGHFDYDTWDDGEIVPSQQWRDSIRNAIASAKVAVLLISADFLISRFINETELDWIRSRQNTDDLAVVPVVIRPCPWEEIPWLSEIQLHPSDGRALSLKSVPEIEEALSSLAVELRRLVGQSAPEAPAPLSEEFEFLSGAEIKEFLANKESTSVIDLIPLFQSADQHSWLAATPGSLYCLLDSEERRRADELIRWRKRAVPGIPIRARIREDRRHSGLVNIGKRQNWLYSRSLYSNPRALEQCIRVLIAQAYEA